MLALARVLSAPWGQMSGKPAQDPLKLSTEVFPGPQDCMLGVGREDVLLQAPRGGRGRCRGPSPLLEKSPPGKAVGMNAHSRIGLFLQPATLQP